MGLTRGRGGQAGSSSRRSMMPTILLMMAFLGTFYVGGRLWQDAELRKMLVEVSEKSYGQGGAALTVDEKLKLVEYKDLNKRVADLEIELVSARKQGYATHNRTSAGKKFKAFLGINTGFGQRSRRDAIRKSWTSSGVSGLKKLQLERGLVVRFIIGRSANRGDSSDRLIDEEERDTQDFLILENHVEASEDFARKTKLYLRAAVEMWDAEFYWKVDDEAFVNLDKLEGLLNSLLDKPQAYVGCMKSGEVVSDPKMRWYESDWWKFGDAKVYYRHASGMMYGLSSAVAQFVAINNDILHEYQNEDISVGSWMLGLNAEYVDERRLCCGAPPDGAICSTRFCSIKVLINNLSCPATRSLTLLLGQLVQQCTGGVMALWMVVLASCASAAWLLTLADCKGIVQTEATFNSYGMDQRYWPDLIYSNATFAKSYILSSGIVNKVYIQDANSGATTSPGYGFRDDVWLYTDGIDNIIYQIPSRGLWHPNRMNPGWPDLVGVNYLSAIKTIQAEVLGAAVIYGPAGFARTEDIRLNRVWLDVDANSTVTVTPRVS